MLEGKAEKEEEVNPDADILKEMPEMDVEFDLPDGQKAQTYSPQALQKMFIAAVRMGEKRAEGKANELVKPLKDEREASQRAIEQEKYLNSELDTAMQWRGMTDHFQDVLDALKKDTAAATKNGKLDKSKLKYRNIRDAYIDIVPAKLLDKATVSEQEIRKKILAEGKTVVKGTSAGSDSVSTKGTDDSDDPITSAILKSIKKIK